MKSLFALIVCCCCASLQAAEPMQFDFARPVSQSPSKTEKFAFVPVSVAALPESLVVRDLPTLTVYVAGDRPCPPCEQFESAAKYLRFDVIIIEDRKKHPSWVTGYPTITWSGANREMKVQEGWYGIDNFLLVYRSSLGIPTPQRFSRVPTERSQAFSFVSR